MFKVYLVNVQTLGAACGYGEGRTIKEAIENALAKAREIDPCAWVEGCKVYFRGGMNR